MPKKITRELLSRINTGFKALFQGALALRPALDPLPSTQYLAGCCVRLGYS